jgi:hypothetical protein
MRPPQARPIRQNQPGRTGPPCTLRALCAVVHGRWRRRAQPHHEFHSLTAQISSRTRLFACGARRRRPGHRPDGTGVRGRGQSHSVDGGRLLSTISAGAATTRSFVAGLRQQSAANNPHHVNRGPARAQPAPRLPVPPAGQALDVRAKSRLRQGSMLRPASEANAIGLDQGHLPGKRTRSSSRGIITHLSNRVNGDAAFERSRFEEPILPPCELPQRRAGSGFLLLHGKLRRSDA